jgi:Ras-related GTP-binding protein A/B
VFDVEKGEAEFQNDLKDYEACINNLSTYSTGANVFLLIHKMDKIKDSEKQTVFNQKKNIMIGLSKGV